MLGIFTFCLTIKKRFVHLFFKIIVIGGDQLSEQKGQMKVIKTRTKRTGRRAMLWPGGEGGTGAHITDPGVQVA